MKTILPALFILLSVLSSTAQSGGEMDAIEQQNPGSSFKTSIDLTDTIVLDMSQAIINGSQINIPVYFLSDEPINSVDFSLKYDHSTLVFDTILSLAGSYLMSFYYYNPNDSILRFTSNSLPVITNDTPLVTVEFTMLTPPMTSADLNTLKGYLNGFTCTVVVIDPSPAGINNSFEQSGTFRVYPNPASDLIMIESDQDATISLYDMQGRLVRKVEHRSVNSKQTIGISAIPNGIYSLIICDEKSTSVRKLVISH